MQLPAMSRINKGLVIAFVALFVFSAILGKYDISLANIMGLSSGGLLSGKIWTVLTYAFLPHGFLECLFDGLIFWFIGSELENMWGPRRYVYFLLTTILGAAFIFLLIGLIFFANTSLAFYPLSGPAGMASTMCVAYGVLFPERTMYFFFFPLQAKWFVILLVGMNLYHGFFTPGGLFAWAQIGAMISGFLWMVFISNPNLKSLFPWTKNAGPRDPKAGSHRRSRKSKNKISHLHIVEPPSEEEPDDGDDTPPTYH